MGHIFNPFVSFTSGGGVAISDDFEGLSLGTDLDDAAAWDVWEASGGVARVDEHDDHSDGSQVIDMSTNGINWCIYQTQVSSADHYVEADVFVDSTLQSGNHVGVLGRGNNSSMGSGAWDGYKAVWSRFDTGGGGWQSLVRIYRVDNDVDTLLDATGNLDGTYSIGTMHTLRLEIDGDTLTAFMNTNQVLQTTDDTYTTGQHCGCYISRQGSGGDSQPFFDNFETNSI